MTNERSFNNEEAAVYHSVFEPPFCDGDSGLCGQCGGGEWEQYC